MDDNVLLEALAKGFGLRDACGTWIPCSKRLPSKSGEYLVTIIQNESSFQQGVTGVFIRALAPANILYGEGFGEQMVWRQELWEDVVAWMPLPKPWKGADDYERAIEQMEHDMLYEPTYNSEDGSM